MSLLGRPGLGSGFPAATLWTECEPSGVGWLSLLWSDMGRRVCLAVHRLVRRPSGSGSELGVVGVGVRDNGGRL